MTYRLESYTPAEREDYLRLLRVAWRDAALSGEEFDWWFERNPAGSLMSVARVDGRVVGVASHSLYRMVLDGENQLAAFSVHATTDESVRGRGIFPAKCTHHWPTTLCVGYSGQGFPSTNRQRETLRNEGDRRTPLPQFRKLPIRTAKVAFLHAYLYKGLFPA